MKEGILKTCKTTGSFCPKGRLIYPFPSSFEIGKTVFISRISLIYHSLSDDAFHTTYYLFEMSRGLDYWMKLKTFHITQVQTYYPF